LCAILTAKANVFNSFAQVQAIHFINLVRYTISNNFAISGYINNAYLAPLQKEIGTKVTVILQINGFAYRLHCTYYHTIIMGVNAVKFIGLNQSA
jgi:Flp pilus assembly protein protease CpaA